MGVWWAIARHARTCSFSPSHIYWRDSVVNQVEPPLRAHAQSIERPRVLCSGVRQVRELLSKASCHIALCWPCMELALSCMQQREAKTVPCGGLCMTLRPWDRLRQAIVHVNGLVSRRYTLDMLQTLQHTLPSPWQVVGGHLVHSNVTGLIASPLLGSTPINTAVAKASSNAHAGGSQFVHKFAQ